MFSHVGTTTLSLPASPGDVAAVNRITCFGNEREISECRFDFYTPLATCSSYAGLLCEGIYYVA